MNTTSRTERLLGPLLESNNDLAPVGECLFLKPVRNLLRYVYVQDFPESGEFYGYWSVELLCCPTEVYELGDEIGGGAPFRNGMDKATFFAVPEDEQSDILRQRVELEALPQLLKFDSVEKAARHFLSNNGPNTDDPQLRFWFELVLGRFDAAKAIQAEHRASWLREVPPPWYEDEELYVRLDCICGLLDLGKEMQIADKLHEWEAIEATKRKIEHIWEPTPFPFETA